MLRREGYAGPLTIFDSDSDAPYDRPNLSKDFLAGTAQDDWILLRSPDYYKERRIDLMLDSRVSAIDTQRKQVQLENGRTHQFGALLIATGADPVRLQVPGATQGQVHYLRTFADSRAIVAKAESAKRVMVVGASFIGLEVAASLRARKIEVRSCTASGRRFAEQQLEVDAHGITDPLRVLPLALADPEVETLHGGAARECGCPSIGCRLE